MNYGRYEIIKEIGKGSMGMVYLARDPHIDRLVALKILRPDRVSSEEFMRRFLKEAKVIGRLSHPNIVAVYDIGEDHGTAYIAEEYLEGDSLDLVIEQQKPPLQDIVAIGISVAETLDYAHHRGIVHRDIKPSNIIVLHDKQVKLTDFSIAHIEDPESTMQTQAGEILGTPAYMSPEQVLGQTVDGRSDLFSLAVILYEMATGERPFKGSGLSGIFRAITTANPTEILTIKPSVPQQLSRIIMTGLAKDPEDRYRNGREMAEALQACCGGNADQQKTVIKMPRNREKPKSLPAANRRVERSPTAERSPMPVLVALAVLVTLGLGGAAYQFFHAEKSGITARSPTTEPGPPFQPQNGAGPVPESSAPPIGSGQKFNPRYSTDTLVSPPTRTSEADLTTMTPPPVREKVSPPTSFPRAESKIQPSPPARSPKAELATVTPSPVREKASPPASPPRAESKIQPSLPTRTPEAHVTQKPPLQTNENNLLSLREKPVLPQATREPGGNSAFASEAEKAKRIEALLVKADAAYDRGDILSRSETSAVRYYNDALAIDGLDTNAYDGIMRVIRKYLELAGKGGSAGKVTGKVNGKSYLSMARECLDGIPEALKHAHVAEIAAVDMEIESMSSRFDLQKSPTQKTATSKKALPLPKMAESKKQNTGR